MACKRRFFIQSPRCKSRSKIVASLKIPIFKHNRRALKLRQRSLGPSQRVCATRSLASGTSRREGINIPKNSPKMLDSVHDTAPAPWPRSSTWQSRHPYLCAGSDPSGSPGEAALQIWGEDQGDVGTKLEVWFGRPLKDYDFPAHALFGAPYLLGPVCRRQTRLAVHLKTCSTCTYFLKRHLRQHDEEVGGLQVIWKLRFQHLPEANPGKVETRMFPGFSCSESSGLGPHLCDPLAACRPEAESYNYGPYTER